MKTKTNTKQVNVKKQTNKQTNKQTSKSVNLQTCQTKNSLMSKKSKRKANKKALNHEPETNANKPKQATVWTCTHRTERTTIPVISQPILTTLLVNQSDCVIFVFKVYE